MTQHRPVLLDEVINYLAINPHGIYLDGTFGRGGHARAILEKLDSGGKLFAMDKDPVAVEAARHHSQLQQDPRFSIQQGSFSDLDQYLAPLGLMGQLDGILLDLGVSSPQLDTPERGFSFTHDGPLDMRMDTTQTLDANRWINTTPEADMADAFKAYGEERYAKRIAKAIVQARSESPITTTSALARIVVTAHPRWEPQKHPATRVFQAIRIAVNHELEDLTRALPLALAALKAGGRLLVISFHSLEDRIVKNFFHSKGTTALIPPGLPMTHAQIQTYLKLKIITGAIRATPAEIRENPRARSAVLRIMEKL